MTTILDELRVSKTVNRKTLAAPFANRTIGVVIIYELAPEVKKAEYASPKLSSYNRLYLRFGSVNG